MGHGPNYIPLNFESDLEHRLETKELSGFSHLLTYFLPWRRYMLSVSSCKLLMSTFFDYSLLYHSPILMTVPTDLPIM